MLERLKARYGQYEREAREAVRKARPTDGLFGMGADPRKHPCHDQFYEDVGSWVAEFLAAEPGTEEAAEAAEWILMAADIHRDEETFWYMYAAQGHARELIPLMPPERRAALRDRYDGAYPAMDRMPVQKTVYKLLRKNTKAKK
ncbi:MAG: hypothetical protein IJ375_01520 [Oscillospiraceae bacterium]|nr:hypothetical protein [Oscillospiraceae bacterium]